MTEFSFLSELFLSSSTVFNIDNNEIFLEQELSILGWILEDHVTLKTMLFSTSWMLNYIQIENILICN